MNFEELLEETIDQVADSRVKEAMRYSLMAGGKRIRPRLLYAVTQGYGHDSHEADAFACGLEMIQTYSLIHDDLPAMDNDDLRRGKPSCHKQFDEATAILAGDGLLTYAFSVAAKSPLKASIVQKCIRILADCAGPDGMVLGQCLDIGEGESDIDWEEIQRIEKYKTGHLLAAPLMMGAAIAGQDDETIEKWKKIGIELGLAFQIQDDILDVELTPEQFGKSNSDERNEKVTSITLLGSDKAHAEMNRLYADAEKQIQTFKGFSAEALSTLIESIAKRHK